jgi:alpha-L-rhamnosidase
MNSFNHYAYGAIGDWMYKVIAGINPVDTAPGYKSILIAPRPGGNLTYAQASLKTLYGTIISSWKLKDGNFTLDIVIPNNTNAEVILPGANERRSVGSGSYHFSYAMPRKNN